MTTAADRLHPALRHHLVNTLGWPRLRPLQEAALGPLAAGAHGLVVGATAGGKTEAALLPLLTRMADSGWAGLSVLYVCPLRALLNDLHPRLEQLCGFLGRRVGIWHGDVGSGARASVRGDPPDLLLTTPESIEAMLISTAVDHRRLFGSLRAVVVDEVHAFAGDDRGWHLLAVLARLQRLAGVELQRVGLSATVANPDELLSWLTPGCEGPGQVLADPEVAGSDVQVLVDHVGSLRNASLVVSRLYRGEKRLVFADSRSRVERMAAGLRERGVTTFVSHSSLGAGERLRAEAAFAEGRDCVMVATSTLELGIDVGDLDRVIQVDAPPSVSSLLQRCGRTGRRPGSVRNVLFLATSTESLAEVCGLTRLRAAGWLEPVIPPARPWHILAQQLLALALQEGAVGRALWPEWLAGVHELQPSPEAGRVLDHLVDQGLLFDEAGMLSVGPGAEQSYGRKHFLALTSVFTSEPLVEVRAGMDEVGHVHPISLRPVGGAAPTLSLGGRGWLVEHVDWRRRVAWVRAVPTAGRSVWSGSPRGLSSRHAGAIRDVVAGADPGADLSRRATSALEEARSALGFARLGETALVTGRERDRWWTFAGLLANAELAARVWGSSSAGGNVTSLSLEVPRGMAPAELVGLAGVPSGPSDMAEELAGNLKFGDCLPADLAVAVATARAHDEEGLARCLSEPVIVAPDTEPLTTR